MPDSSKHLGTYPTSTSCKMTSPLQYSLRAQPPSLPTRSYSPLHTHPFYTSLPTHCRPQFLSRPALFAHQLVTNASSQNRRSETSGAPSSIRTPSSRQASSTRPSMMPGSAQSSGPAAVMRKAPRPSWRSGRRGAAHCLQSQLSAVMIMMRGAGRQCGRPGGLGGGRIGCVPKAYRAPANLPCYTPHPQQRRNL